MAATVFASRAYQARSLLMALSLAGLIYAEPAWSCSCDFKNKEFGFVSKNYLPANAKGVLLLRQVPGNLEHIQIDEKHIVVYNRPRPLNQKTIIGIDKTTNKTLVTQLRKLTATELWWKVADKKYLWFKQGLPESCFSNYKKPACKAVQQLINQPENINQQILAGKLLDVSDEFARSYGLFRVEPQESFQINHTYEFSLRPEIHDYYRNNTLDKQRLYKLNPNEVKRLLAEQDEYRPAWQTSLELKIGPVTAAANQQSYSLLKVGSVQIRTLNVAVSSRCSTSQTRLVQELKLTVPDAYQHYANSLQYFWQLKTTGSEFNFFAYHSSLCSQLGFNESELPPGTEKIYDEWPSGEDKPSSYRVRAYAGLLELDDQLHLTPEIEVTLPATTSSNKPGKK